MSCYKGDNLETARQTDKIILDVEQSDPNVVSWVVPVSRLHEIIHNPITEGIDEG